MWDIRFWSLFIIALILTGIVSTVKKMRFIDVQLIIMTAALALSCDMLLCKQFDLYHYISLDYKGWYSLWANIVIVPAWGFLFIKLLPKSNLGAALYITVWTLTSTLFELFVVKPVGVVVYHGWNIIPYSLIGFFLVLTWIYTYYRILISHK